MQMAAILERFALSRVAFERILLLILLKNLLTPSFTADGFFKG
jgi:hypothetical protein